MLIKYMKKDESIIPYASESVSSKMFAALFRDQIDLEYLRLESKSVIVYGQCFWVMSWLGKKIVQ